MLGGTALLWPVAAALKENELQRWNIIADFKKALEGAFGSVSLHSSWADPKRGLALADYLSLFLFGLLNPVVRTLRGLCAASQLPRAQAEVCSGPVSLGSFSEAQHVLDPALLEKVFADLGSRLQGAPPSGPGSAGAPRWLIQDSTLWEALPRMGWAVWRHQGVQQNAVRLHVTLHLLEDAPVRAQVSVGAHCERKAWKQVWRPGDAYIGDRYYGEDYQLFGQLEALGCLFVIRLRANACVEIQEERPVRQEDRAQGVLRQAWVLLGHPKMKARPRVRVVWVQGPEEVLLLATNQTVEALSAALVSQLYRQRWQVELFFRWIKCILGCRHWLAESPAGVAAQIYLALIGSLLLQLYSGKRPTRRMMELIQFYLLGVATLEDLEKGLAREAARQARQKKR